jgi:SPP1 gp7 family putative phage head morphogenesis protein
MKMNVPPAEALRIAGVPIDVKAYPWLEETYVNINLVPITSLSGEGGTEPEPKPGPKKPPTAPPKKMFDGLEDKALGLLGATERAGAEARAKASEKWIKGVLNPGERTLRAKMQRHLSGLKREMLDKVDAWLGRQEARTIRQVSIDPKAFVFSKAQAAEQLEGIIRDNISQQAKREEAHLKQEYGDAIKWNASDETIAQFVRERQTYIKQINTHTFNAARAKIGQIVQQGIENNWTPQELAKALKAGIKAIPTGGSAARIARTETGSISNRARFDAFQQSEIKRHQWSTSRDELVRNTHMIDGEEQDVGKMFSNGLHFPQEPGAPASEVINCRCTVLPLV